MNCSNLNLSDKMEVREAINNGIPCYYRSGFAFKGAKAELISQQKALKLLPHYSPGIGFYELSIENSAQTGGRDAIVFNEYSEADLL